MSENKRKQKDKHLDLHRKLKVLEHESDNNIHHSWSHWKIPQEAEKKAGLTVDQRKNWDHTDHRSAETW